MKQSAATWVQDTMKCVEASVEQDDSWQKLSLLCGIALTGSVAIPVMFGALPTSSQGRRALNAAALASARFEPVAASSMHTALLCGGTAPLILQAWRHLHKFRNHALLLLEFFADKGMFIDVHRDTVHAQSIIREWESKLMPAFGTLHSQYREYEAFQKSADTEAHGKGIQDDARLNVSTGPTWKELRSAFDQAGRLFTDIENHIIAAVAKPHVELQVQASLIFKACAKPGSDSDNFRHLLCEEPSSAEVVRVLLTSLESGAEDRMAQATAIAGVFIPLGTLFRSLIKSTSIGCTPSEAGFTGDFAQITWEKTAKASEVFHQRLMLFLCISTAWEMMLSEDSKNKKNKRGNDK